ncbi:hypothetical protein VaNZ11_006756, partial [Volvox africanus]
FTGSGGSFGPKGLHCEKSLSSSRSLPGWLLGHRHRGAHIRSDTVDVSPGLESLGAALKKTTTQQVVLQASHSYLHGQGETATSTMSSACLPPVEELRPEQWVTSDAVPAAFPRPPTGGVGAADEMMASFGSSGPVEVAAAAGTNTGLGASGAVGGGSRATSSTSLMYVTEAEAAAAAISDDNRSVRRQRREMLRQGSQPLYGRPHGVRNSFSSLSTVGALVPHQQQQQQQQQQQHPQQQQVLLSSSRQAAVATAVAPSTSRRTASKFSQRSSSTPASRSGSSRLGSSSLSNFSTSAAATSGRGRREGRRNRSCLPVAFASAALLNVFSSFRSTRSKFGRTHGCEGAGDSSIGGDASIAIGGGSVHDPSGSTGANGGSTDGGGGSGSRNAGGADMLPCRLSVGKCGLSPLSNEKRASTGSNTAGPSVSNVISTDAIAAAATSEIAAGDVAAGGRRQMAAPGGSVVEYKYNVVSVDGCSGVGVGVGFISTDDDSNNKLMRQSAACLYGARSSLNVPCYGKPSGTSSGPLGITRSSGDGSPSLQSAAIGGRGSCGSCCCDTFLPPQIVGPTIPESEEGAAGLGASGGQSCWIATAPLPSSPPLPQPAPPSRCQQNVDRAPAVETGECSGGFCTATATTGRSRGNTANVSPVARLNAIATTAAAAVIAAGSVATSWRLPGMLATSSVSAGASSARKVTSSSSVAQAAGAHHVMAGSPFLTGGGEGASAVSPRVGRTEHRVTCTTMLTGDDETDTGFGRPFPPLGGQAYENASAGNSSSTKRGGGIRSRLRSFKMHVKDLLVGTK